MLQKKIIAVVGATGAQGGGLVRAILDDPASGYAVRVVTREASGPMAREFAERGAEIAVANLDDADSLKKAFAGAYGAFCVTFFWDHFSPDIEMAQAKSMAAAAKSCNVKHVIWSTLEDTRQWVPLEDDRMPTLQAKYKVPHLDGKADADRAFSDAGVPVTFLRTSFYWENFIHFGMGPKPSQDGRLALTLPMGKQPLPGIAAEDIGRCAYGLFKQGTAVIGRTVAITGENLTGAEMAAAFSAALQRDVAYCEVSPEAYRGFGFPGADELGNMFQVKRDFSTEYAGARSPKFSQSLNPKLQDFRTWLSLNSGRIPLG